MHDLAKQLSVLNALPGLLWPSGLVLLEGAVSELSAAPSLPQGLGEGVNYQERAFLEACLGRAPDELPTIHSTIVNRALKLSHALCQKLGTQGG